MKSRITSLRSYHEANKGIVNKGNAYSVPPAAIEEESGFNPRNYERPEVQEHIRAFAEAYKRGDYVPPIVVRVEDGRLLVRDGHCRRLGLMLAIAEGAAIERTPVVEHKGDEVQQNLLVLTSNQGLPITALERAEIYRRLHAWGKTPDEIALSVGRSVTHVAQYLQLVDLPIKLKEAINNNQVSPSTALEQYQQHGSKAEELITSAIEQGAASGRTRVTSKHLQAGPRITRKVAVSMADHIQRITDRLEQAAGRVAEGETLQIELTREEAEELLALRAKLKPAVTTLADNAEA